MTYWYIFDANARVVIKGPGHTLPTLPSGLPHLKLRTFDRVLSAEDEVTELQRAVFQYQEVNSMRAAEAGDSHRYEMQLAKLHGLWVEYRQIGSGQPINAFAKYVLQTTRDVASRVIARDLTLDPDDVQTMFDNAISWQSANPFSTSSIQ